MKWLKEVWSNLIGYLGFDGESSILSVLTAAVILFVLALCWKRLEQWWGEKREKTPQGLFWPQETNVFPGKKTTPSAVLKPFNRAIPLCGRENEMILLYDFFLQDKKVPISIWAIVGEGGIGKTKLAYEAASSFRDTNAGWDTLWWGANNVQYDPETRLHWTDNSYPRDLIVVVDSVGSQPDAFAAELRKLSPERENRLRILLVERENVKDGKNPLWLDRLLGSPNANTVTELAHFFYGYDKTNTFSGESFLTLKKLNRDALRDILRNLHGEDPMREQKMLDDTKWASGSTLLFLVAAMLQDRENAPQSPEEVLDYCLQIEEENRQRLCGVELAESVRRLLVYATLVGQWTARDAVPETFGLSEAAETVKTAANTKKHRRLLDDLGGSSRNYTLDRYTPDYFGEYFALKELERLKNLHGEETLECLLITLWEQEKTHEGYAYFLLRAIEDHPEQELLREALEYQKDSLEKAELLTLLGGKLFYWGRYKNAADLYEQALHIREQLLGNDDPLVADSYNNLGNAFRGLGRYEKAKEQHEQALAIFRDQYGESHPDTASSYNNLGNAFRGLGRYEEAIEQHEQALAIYRDKYGKNHPDTAMSYNHLGNAYNGLGDYNKAKELHEQALTIYRDKYGENHPDTAMSYGNLGVDYDDLGDYNKAKEQLEKALAIFLDNYGENHPDTASSYNNLGVAYDDLGDYNKAKEQHEKALSIRLRILGENHPDTARNYNNLGNAYGNLGRYDEAIELHEKALTIRLSVLGEKHPDTAKSYYNLGADYYLLRKYPEAMNNYRSAFSIALVTIGPDHPQTRVYASNIARCAEAMGDTTTAERYRYFAEHGEFPDTP